MSSSEERLYILSMIEEGKISAEEGTRLLAAMGEPDLAGGNPASEAAIDRRNLRIRVTDLATGTQKVNVNIPVSLVTFALRFVPDADVQAVREAIATGLTGRIADIQDHEDGQHVEIFLD